MALSFDEIIEKYRENSTSERNKGDRFERLMKAYLLTKPVYKNLLTDVWLWSEFPYKDQFGYIIIPVIVPAKANADEILDTSDDFKIVWSVLNALYAHDDRFNATINKIELNKKKPEIIKVVKGGRFNGKPVVGDDDTEGEPVQGEFVFDELQQQLYDKFNA